MRSADIRNLLTDLEKSFSENANSENGLTMSAYMKGHFQFYGVMAPLRKQLTREWLKTFPKNLSSTERWLLLEELWKKDQREFQYVAVDYLNHWRNDLIDEEDAVKLKDLIVHRSWWDSVDLLASGILGKYCMKYPNRRAVLLTEWRNSENVWLQRSCLLFQLKYKEKTDFDLLKELIRQFSPTKEFFIQKAIGWSLRQYSKTDPEAVRQFVLEIGLKGLAAKEAMKHLNR
ncbi:MAG: DNA alkylation repair protein [Flavobacteriia bacterium]|jgi:3-methyladenine DNA glycosylase AlkD